MPVLPTVNVLLVPQILVVILADPSNDVLFIVLAVSKVVAVAELPVHLRAEVAAPPTELEPAYACVWLPREIVLLVVPVGN